MTSPPISRKFVGEPMTIRCIFILSGINSYLNRLGLAGSDHPHDGLFGLCGMRSAWDELCIGTRSSLPAFFPSLINRMSSLWTLTHVYRDTLLTLNTLKQKAFPFLQTAASYKKNKKNRGKYSTTSSLNKESPSSEVHVSKNQQGEILNHLFFE